MLTKNIRIVVSGDFCPTEHVEAKLRSTNKPEDYLGEAVDCFRDADLSIANLEYPLTTGKNKIRKYGSHQKGDPHSITILEQGGVDLVTLANNHILDYGEKGLLDTLTTCRAHSIDSVGAGMTLKEAKRIYYKDVRGIKIAVVAFCENEFSVANEDHGGAAPMDFIENLRQIQEAKQNANIVLVIIHGGNEFSHFPSPRTVKQYRFYASLGVSAVINHHPHYIQGYEIYDGVPILYSLGKLLYTRMKDPYILEVPIGILDFDPNTLECNINFKFYKISLEKTKLENLNKLEKDELEQRFKGYCKLIEDQKKLAEEWDRYCKERQFAYFAKLTLLPHVVFKILRRLNLQQLIVGYASRRAIKLREVEDFVRCESHRDALLSILENLRKNN